MADEIEILKKEISLLKQRVDFVEKPGVSLYYALIRKQNEMAALLNETSLRSSLMESDKSFERLRYLWNDAKDLVINTKLLGEAMGVTGNEERDTSRLTTFLDKNAT